MLRFRDGVKKFLDSVKKILDGIENWEFSATVCWINIERYSSISAASVLYFIYWAGMLLTWYACWMPWSLLNILLVMGGIEENPGPQGNDIDAEQAQGASEVSAMQFSYSKKLKCMSFNIKTSYRQRRTRL
jgi:hypothetical protein